jgi:DNA-binding IscR family transcriptional regulator
MTFDARLSGALHLLLHMAEFDGPVTSSTLAQAMRTNPVVVRRMMAGLRRNGYVQSERGHGGGWVISCDLETTTLLDIYRALGSPTLIGLGLGEPASRCLVERAVESSLADARREAEQVLLDRFADVTLAALSKQFHQSWTKQSASYLEDVHGI